MDKIRATPEPEDARTAVDAPFPPGGPTNTSELPPKKVTEGASGSNQAPAPDEGFGGLGNPPPPGASPEDSRSQTVDSQDMPGEDEKVTGNLGDPPLPGGSPEDSRSETVDSQDMPGGDEEVTGDEDRPESAKCIVFVSRVLTAQVLTDLLTTMTSMGGLRAAALTGHSKVGDSFGRAHLFPSMFLSGRYSPHFLKRL